MYFTGRLQPWEVTGHDEYLCMRCYEWIPLCESPLVTKHSRGTWRSELCRSCWLIKARRKRLEMKHKNLMQALQRMQYSSNPLAAERFLQAFSRKWGGAEGLAEKLMDIYEKCYERKRYGLCLHIIHLIIGTMRVVGVDDHAMWSLSQARNHVTPSGRCSAKKSVALPTHKLRGLF